MVDLIKNETFIYDRKILTDVNKEGGKIYRLFCDGSACWYSDRPLLWLFKITTEARVSRNKKC
jgi:hypothetical protein